MLRSNMRTSFTSKLGTNGIVPRQMGQWDDENWGSMDDPVSPSFMATSTQDEYPKDLLTSFDSSLGGGTTEISSADFLKMDNVYSMPAGSSPVQSTGSTDFSSSMKFINGLVSTVGTLAQAGAKVYSAVTGEEDKSMQSIVYAQQQAQKALTASQAQQTLQQQQAALLAQQARDMQVAAAIKAAQAAAIAKAAATKKDYAPMIKGVGFAAGIALVAWLAVRK